MLNTQDTEYIYKTMEDRHRAHNASNGFWLGLVLGVVLTLLFTTKKGRQILNVLLDKGMEKISDLEDKIRENEYMDDVDEDGDYIKREPHQEVRYIAETESNPSSSEEEEEVVSKSDNEKLQSVTSSATIEKEIKKKETNGHATNGHAANDSRFANAKRFFKKASKRS